MMIHDQRLDKTRDCIRFADYITERIEEDGLIVYRTEVGNIIICREEPYRTEASKEECPDKDELFEMVKFVITKNEIIKGSEIEPILR